MSRNIPITEFDTLTLNPSMQMLKALIPFLDYPMQRQVSLIIRITELQQTMRFFSNPSCVSGFSSSSTGCAEKIHSIDDIFNNEKLLDTLLIYCPENYASMIKTFRRFSKMSDIFNAMNLSNEDIGNMFNTFFSGNSDETADNGFGNAFSNGFGNDSANNSDNNSGNNSESGFNAAYKDNSNNSYNSNDNSNGANDIKNLNTSNGSNNSTSGNSSAFNNKTGKPFVKLPPNLNMAGLGNLLGAAPTNSLLNSFMKPEQQAMYDEYIRQLNNLNFDEPKNKPENNSGSQ